MNALIVEGGGMKGIFSVGVLDAFMEANFDPYDMYIGVSSGACNLPSHIAGQFKRNFRSYTTHMSSKDFLDFNRFLKGGHYMDLDWLWEMTQKENPIDFDKAYEVLEKEGKNLYVIATDAKTGSPVYLQPNPEDWLDCLKGSSALPLFYKKGCIVNDTRLIDGVLSAPLPVEFAIRQGAKKVTIIRSQKYRLAKPPSFKTKLFSLFLMGSPQVRKSLLNFHNNYNHGVESLEKINGDVEILQIIPERSMKTNQTTQEFTTLRNDYNMGFQIGKKFVHIHNTKENISVETT